MVEEIQGLDLWRAVKIKEEDIVTGEHFQAQSFELVLPPSTGWQELDISFPIPISILSAIWTNKATYDGDEVEFLVAPDTIIGALTAPVGSGIEELSVSPTVIENMAVGKWVKVDAEDLGRCLAIDTTNSKITVENETTTSHDTGASVKMTVKLSPHIYLNGGGGVGQIGASAIGGSHVPANTVLRFRYNNLTGIGKKWSFILEYFY